MLLASGSSTKVKFVGLADKTLVPAGTSPTGPTKIKQVSVVNENEFPAYLLMFDSLTLAAVTLGVTIPDDVIVVPPTNYSAQDDIDPAFDPPAGYLFKDYGLNGPSFSTGVVIAACTDPQGLALCPVGDVYGHFEVSGI